MKFYIKCGLRKEGQRKKEEIKMEYSKSETKLTKTWCTSYKNLHFFQDHKTNIIGQQIIISPKNKFSRQEAGGKEW